MLNYALYQMETVNLILYTHIEWCCDGSFLLISVYMNISVGTTIGQLVDQCMIPMECKDDWLIFGEQCIVLCICQTMRMLGAWLKFHQIDNIDHANLNLRHCLS